MSVTLRADVSMTDTDTGLVLLDERTGKYWQTNATGAFVLHQLLDGTPAPHVVGLLRERYSVDAGGFHGLPHQCRIKPAATAPAAGIDAIFVAAVTKKLADLVIQFGRKRAADRRPATVARSIRSHRSGGSGGCDTGRVWPGPRHIRRRRQRWAR